MTKKGQERTDRPCQKIGSLDEEVFTFIVLFVCEGKIDLPLRKCKCFPTTTNSLEISR